MSGVRMRAPGCRAGVCRGGHERMGLMMPKFDFTSWA